MFGVRPTPMMTTSACLLSPLRAQCLMTSETVKRCDDLRRPD